MNSDLILVSGLVLGIFAVPGIVSALSDRRSLRVAALVLVAACAIVFWASHMRPGGYSLRDVPDAVIRVLGYVF